MFLGLNLQKKNIKRIVQMKNEMKAVNILNLIHKEHLYLILIAK